MWERMNESEEEKRTNIRARFAGEEDAGAVGHDSVARHLREGHAHVQERRKLWRIIIVMLCVRE